MSENDERAPTKPDNKPDARRALIERVLAEAREAARAANEAAEEVQQIARSLPKAAAVPKRREEAKAAQVPAVAAPSPGEPKEEEPGAIAERIERSRRRSQILEHLNAITAAEVRGNVDAGKAFDSRLEGDALQTVCALAADLADYAGFCRRRQLTGVPALPSTVECYIDDMRRRKNPLAIATVMRRLASIAKVHRIFSLESPTRSEIVRAALRKHRRSAGMRQAQARAIRLRGEGGIDADPGRELCIENLIAACDDSLTGRRNAALLSMAYDAGLRVSELRAVEIPHLRRSHATGEGSLYIPKSKTDQERRGQWAWLSAATMRHVERWRMVSGIASGPLFRRIHTGRQRGNGERARERVGNEALTTAGVAHILRSAIVRAARQGAIDLAADDLARALREVSTHSFRVGATQDLYAAGADTGRIMKSFRWTSAATPLTYVRELAADQGAAAMLLRERRKV